MFILPDREIEVVEDENICTTRKYYRACFKSPRNYSRYFEIIEPITFPAVTWAYPYSVPPSLEDMCNKSYMRRKTIELKQMCALTEKEAVQALLDDYVEQYYKKDEAEEARDAFTAQLRELRTKTWAQGSPSECLADYDAVLVSEARLKFMKLNVGDKWMGYKLCAWNCDKTSCNFHTIRLIKTERKK